jgi:hypothetical protein
MKILYATVRNGRLELPPLPEFPEGAEVEITLQRADEVAVTGLKEEDCGDDLASIRKRLALLEAIEPPDIPDEEWKAIRRNWQLQRVVDRAVDTNPQAEPNQR